MGKGQRLPELHVGWIKSPPGWVAGGPQEDSATPGQLPVSGRTKLMDALLGTRMSLNPGVSTLQASQFNADGNDNSYLFLCNVQVLCVRCAPRKLIGQTGPCRPGGGVTGSSSLALVGVEGCVRAHRPLAGTVTGASPLSVLVSTSLGRLCCDLKGLRFQIGSLESYLGSWKPQNASWT